MFLTPPSVCTWDQLVSLSKSAMWVAIERPGTKLRRHILEKQKRWVQNTQNNNINSKSLTAEILISITFSGIHFRQNFQHVYTQKWIIQKNMTGVWFITPADGNTKCPWQGTECYLVPNVMPSVCECVWMGSTLCTALLPVCEWVNVTNVTGFDETKDFKGTI